MKQWLLSFLLAAVHQSALAAPSPGGQSRGEMLYSNHCIGCHRTAIHWRQQRLVTDWPSLYAQVRRWQVNTGRSWDAEDTAAIARYLNDTFYHFPPGEEIRN